MRVTFVPILACAALLLAVPSGCSDTSNGTGDDQPVTSTLVGRSCSVDSECGNLRCDAERHLCICLADTDCAEAKDKDGNAAPFCNNITGLCDVTVSGCKSDSECGSAAMYCDTHTRSCKVRKGFCEVCDTDRECGGDADDCLQDASLGKRFCGKTCASDGDCPTGATCQDFTGKKQCWPKAGKNCRTFTGCTPDSRKPCSTNGDCKEVPDQVCDPGSGVCVARLQICPFNQVCDSRSRVCVDACSSDADCQLIDAKLRCVSRACEPVGECAATSDDPSGDKSCPVNKVCSIPPGGIAGNCVPFCGSSQECPQGTICSKTQDNRSKCITGCVANADCPLDRKCVKAGGASVGTCQGVTGQTCQADSVCPTCNTCDVATNTCVLAKAGNYCKPCSGDTECGFGHCLQLTDGKRCGQPCPATGCPRGFLCAEVCLGTYSGYNCQGTRVAQCVPVDQNCTANAANKCGF